VNFIKLKMELHCHTDFDPEDWIGYSAYQLIDAAARQGIGVLAVTCHRALQWSKALAEYAESAGVLLIPGVEASIEGKHVLIYGLERFHHPMSFRELRELRRLNPDILAIAPHPFYPAASCLGQKLFEYRDCFDAVEYCHFYTRHINFNDEAVAAARALQKPLVGTSDIHFLAQIGKTTSTVTVPERSFAAVSAAIKSGKVELHTKPLPWLELSSQILKMNWMSTKSFLRRRGLLTQRPVSIQNI
jgi:predicted metal-dependent phosphoesterase TrpH